MQYRLPLVVALSTLLMVACSPGEPLVAEADVAAPETAAEPPSWFVPAADPGSDVQVLKSPADTRGYRFVTLANGLKVLLVSDPEADKAAASLSIHVGSFENPAERDGLAHFLEHMLFLGTDKYPEPGEYQAFLTEHGGSFNAYTSLEETNYFFDVDADHLLPTLDRFARFFVAPLFNEEYVDRERHAVDSEYQLKIKDDSRREWDVLRELANPVHPFSRFSVGSLETLANPPENPVREDLVAFYRSHYSASEMNLVVLGRESLDELHQQVAARFAEVPAQQVALPRSDTPLFASDLPLRVDIQPVKEIRSLSFNFPLPSVAADWRLKPTEYLGHLLGHEGEGSLLADLKRRGLADALSSGLVFDSRHGALFSVTIDLTREGVAQQDQVTRDFFSWLALVKSRGLEQWRYDEVARLRELDFRFVEKSPPMRYVSSLSNALHSVDPRDVLRANHLYGGFDAERIGYYASFLRADNVAVVLTAPDVVTDRATVLYDAPYRVAPVAPETLLANADQAGLKLPAPNPYVADKVELLAPGQAVAAPLKVAADGELWHYPDSQFGTPKAYFEARITLPGANSLEREALLTYLLALVQDQLAPEIYPAMLAGLNFSLSPWEHGFTIALSGYSAKQHILLGRILHVLNNPDWDPGRAERVRGLLVRNLRNTTREWPLRQLFTRLNPLLVDTWLPTQHAEVIERLAIPQLQSFHAGLKGVGEGRFYAGGNLSRPEAGALVAQVNTALELGDAALDPVRKVNNLARAATLPATRYYVDHPDSAALLYLQGDQDSLGERASFALLQVIASAPFYSSLRTEKQLGYAVGSSIAHRERVPGMLFYVQSPKVDADALRGEIKGFLAQFEAAVAGVTEEDLARYRQSVLANLEEKPRNIRELAARHLESLNLGYTGFDFREQLAAALESITLADLKADYRRIAVGERAGLWVLTSGDETVGVGEPLPASHLETPFEYSY